MLIVYQLPIRSCLSYTCIISREVAGFQYDRSNLYTLPQQNRGHLNLVVGFCALYLFLTLHL